MRELRKQINLEDEQDRSVRPGLPFKKGNCKLLETALDQFYDEPIKLSSIRSKDNDTRSLVDLSFSIYHTQIGSPKKVVNVKRPVKLKILNELQSPVGLDKVP